jgi:hypothetical protein
VSSLVISPEIDEAGCSSIRVMLPWASPWRTSAIDPSGTGRAVPTGSRLRASTESTCGRVDPDVQVDRWLAVELDPRGALRHEHGPDLAGDLRGGEPGAERLVGIDVDLDHRCGRDEVALYIDEIRIVDQHVDDCPAGRRDQGRVRRADDHVDLAA